MSAIPDPHKPLRDDVRLLGELLGETLRARRGRGALRSASSGCARWRRAARAGDDGDFDAARRRELAPMPVDVGGADRARVRALPEPGQHRRAAPPRPPPPRLPRATRTRRPQPGSCDEAFARLVARRAVAPDALARRRLHRCGSSWCSPRIRPRSSRRTLLQKHSRIADALAARDRPDLTPDGARRRRSTRCGARSRPRGRPTKCAPQRPSPLDEVRGGLVGVRADAVGRAAAVPARARSRAARSTGRGLPLDAAPIRFGSWIGGDRDGNPNVTPEVTRQRRACWRAGWPPTCTAREIEALRDELSMAPRERRAARRASATRAEPYRALLRERARRGCARRATLAAARGSTPERRSGRRRRGDVYLDADDLAEPLRALPSLARGDRQRRCIADGRLTDVLRRVAAFGLTLAPARHPPGAARHTEALDCDHRARSASGRYEDWDEDGAARVPAARARASRARSLIPPTCDADARGPRRARHVPDDRAACRPESLGAYVITMASRAVGRARRRAAAEASRRRAAAARRAAVRDRATTCERAGAVLDTLLVDAVVSRRASTAARR